MTDKKLGIIETLQRVGEDNVRLQFVANSMTNIQLKKSGDVLVTFATGKESITPNDVASGQLRNVGVILWLPKPLVDKAVSDFAAEVPL